MQSVYSIAPVNRATTGGEFYPFAEMQSVYHTAPTDRATSEGSLTYLQRCSHCIPQPQWQGYELGRSLTPLQRCSRCILQPQLIGLVNPRKWILKINLHLQILLWFLFYFNGISIFMRYLMPNPFLEKGTSSTIWSITMGKRIFILLPGILVRKWTS